MKLTSDSVRGGIWNYVERNRELLLGHVLELGAKWPHEQADFADFRRLSEARSWTGVDFSPGKGVDKVEDIQHLTFRACEFDAVLCAEVLEHVRDPQAVCDEANRVLRPGGWAIFTTLTAFPIHDYPNDFWRFTPQGLALLLERAGFLDIEVETFGIVTMQLTNTGAVPPREHSCPRHVFARGRK